MKRKEKNQKRSKETSNKQNLSTAQRFSDSFSTNWITKLIVFTIGVISITYGITKEYINHVHIEPLKAKLDQCRQEKSPPYVIFYNNRNNIKREIVTQVLEAPAIKSNKPLTTEEARRAALLALSNPSNLIKIDNTPQPLINQA